MPTDKNYSSKKRWVYFLLLIGLLSITFASIIGIRLFNKVGHRVPPIPRQTDVGLIQEWMTVPFIARSYNVPEPLLFEKLGVDPNANRRSSLSSIAAKTGQTTQQIIDLIKQQVTVFQLSQTEVLPP